MYVCMYVRTNERTYICMYVRTCVHVRAYVRLCMNVCMYVCQYNIRVNVFSPSCLMSSVCVYLSLI